MQSPEALEERAWQELPTLRRLLRDKRREFEDGLYLTSISDSAFDHFRRFAVLAAFVVQERETLIGRIRAEIEYDQDLSRQSALVELDHLKSVLGALSSRLNALANEVGLVQRAIYASRASNAEP